MVKWRSNGVYGISVKANELLPLQNIVFTIIKQNFDTRLLKIRQ